ncbi:MAG: type 1 glutamine amidotransferase [Actinomycetia bacterium]|nr:type 1 glutamine amidotransferase [Actinomycetes bacterium]
MRVGIVQHITVETAGTYGDVLTEAGVDTVPVVVADHPRLPDWHALDGIVVLGGPMSATDDDRYSWLRGERAWIRAAVEAGRPFLGVCLGAQLLALALGGSVYPGPAPEVGIAPVALTPEAERDPLFAGLPGSLSAFHWHGDTFSLPPGAVLLAGSASYAHQVFRWGSAAWGIQCHFEVGADAARAWAELPPYAAALQQAHGADALGPLLTAMRREEAAWRRTARHLAQRWLDVVRARSTGGPPAPAPGGAGG